GAPAAVERRIGAGRVILWTSTLDDSWTDIAVKPIFLPLVQQLVRYLAHYQQPSAWLTVGQVLDLGARPQASRLVVTPTGERIAPSGNELDPRPVIELGEQGFYELRQVSGGAASSRPE